MTAPSIGTRLTAWYVSVLTVALVAFGAGSWWLSTRSVVRAADTGLDARIQGVRDFLLNPRTHLTIDELQEEFGEYAELTRGEALLEVVDGAGTVLCKPSIAGWEQLPRAATSGRLDGQAVDRTIGGMPFRVASAALDANGRIYTVTVAAPMGPAYAALNRFHEWLLLLLPLTIVLAGAGGYFVSRRALAPVDQITRAVRAITVQNLDRRLDLPPADDELRRLAATFNGVLAQLEAAVGDIVRFTAEASHELRTPVSLMRTTAELALRHPRSPEEYRRALGDVASQAQHMSSLIDDLMVLARSDAGIETRAATELDLRDALGEAVREIGPAAADRAVALTVDLPPAPVTLRGDEDSLRRALLILLENAIKYSTTGGHVRVGLEESGPGENGPLVARVSISDSGIGLEESERSHLFDRFYRGARAREHAPEGTGLGLAIARTIVDRHGGSIALEPGPGGGCEARLTLPAVTAQPI